MTTSKKNKYKCLENYMVRTPLISCDLYFDEFNLNNNIKSVFLHNKKIQEAILTSSNSLYESLLKDNKKLKKIKQEESSLLKYMIRMSTRTTPYALFSGVGLGDFKDFSKINDIDLTEGFKYMRIDMEWEFELLNKIESNDDILKNLKVYSNDISTQNGNRLDNIYVSNYGQASKGDLKSDASINYTSKVEDVISFSMNGIKVKDLIDLLNTDGKYDNEVIFNFVKQLISNEYLITELRPPLVNTDTTEYILNKLKNIKEAEVFYNSLNEIYEMINKYNKTTIGDGINIFKDIVSKMKELCESKNYLQIDLKKETNICSLNKSVKEDVEKLVEVLLKISSGRRKNTYLDEFAHKFNEKYGIYREVNILEVLDMDRGIGLPSLYLKQGNDFNTYFDYTIHDRKYDEILNEKLNECILCNNDEIVFDDNDLEYISKDNTNLTNKDTLLKSLDINIFIKSKSADSIDKGDYELFIGPNYGSSCAGKMFGRFAHMFDNNLGDMFSKIDESITGIEDESILVEITELPTSGRLANVCKNYNKRKYELAIATNKSELTEKISIKDVYVGVDENNKFYFRSNKLNKKLIFTSNNMLNLTLGSGIHRFLLDVCENSSIDVFERAYNVGFKNLISIPRVKYKNMIISPYMWKINKNSIIVEKDTEQSLINLKRFIEKNNVHKYIYAGQNDNRLVLDMENDKHIMELLDIVKKSQEYTLISELEFSKSEVWMKDKNNKSYISEFVFSLVLDEQNIVEKEDIIESNDIMPTKSNIAKNQVMVNTFSKNRMCGLLNDWVYFKFYGTDKRIDEFLGLELSNLAKVLYENNIIDKFFYLRYADPDSHIRFRVKLSSEEKRLELFNLMDTFVIDQINRGLISKVNIDTYFKELERYGGLKCFKKVERLFFDDSLITMNLIALKRTKEISIDNILVACVNIIHIMESLGIDFDKQNSIFQLLYNQKDGRDTYREKSKDLLFYCNSNGDWENLRSTEDGRKIYNNLIIREDSFKEYWETVNSEDELGSLSNSKIDILLSVIHMFCNRYLNTRDEERVAMQMVRHTLHALKYKKKHLCEARNGE